jgi:hypothetical protein
VNPFEASAFAERRGFDVYGDDDDNNGPSAA